MSGSQTEAETEWALPLGKLPSQWTRWSSSSWPWDAWQMVAPINLTVLYPFENPPVWQVGIALVFLIAITVFVFLLRDRYPYFITGWLWYLVMLLPVIGVYQIGLHSHADRYTYLPQIGLYIAFAWWLTDVPFLRGRWPILNGTFVLMVPESLSVKTSSGCNVPLR